jgi:hypothetical protein
MEKAFFDMENEKAYQGGESLFLTGSSIFD